MQHRSGTMFAALLGVVLASAGAVSAAEEISQQQRQFFESRIRPILVKHCFECHSQKAETLSSDYAVDSRPSLRRGGATGEPAIVPGEPQNSRLLDALRYDGLEMPPDGKLPDHVIADFERWIAMGAPDPRTADPQSIRETATADELWSFQPPVKPAIPNVKAGHWPLTAIDDFILARLEQERLRPVPSAGPRKLIRRVFFDLTGLPPSPQEVDAFAANPTQSAFENIVDRLLNSPHFGERWGRHWLDLARYAESSGMEFNFTYPHAWPYRDYVIDAFNEDKPYDRFITEQLAGDLLPAASKAERDEQRLATGFLAIGPKRHNAGTTDFRMDIVDDQIRATSEAILGLTVGCARCHDHKFDPIPTEDYYALAGIFLSTQTLHGTTKVQYSRHPSDLVAFGPEADARHQRFTAHQKQLKDAEEELEKKQTALKELKPKNDDQDEAKSDQKQSDQEQSNAEKREQLKKQIAALQKTITQLKENAPEPPLYGMGAADGNPSDTHVAIGGDPRKKGEEVPRGFLSHVRIEPIPEITGESSGRLQLARWITSRDNPLTARVMVNRVWHHLFGRGLVPTVNNFGVLGERPSHPELLDYLAVRFMDDGWSVKRLIRSVVLSRTYQLSTQSDSANIQADPQNILLWRMTPRRLEVEPLRDAILAVSGQLDLSRPHGSTVTGLGQQLARRVSWEKLNPPNRHRTVYLPVVRHYASHMHQEFDFAASSLVVGDRAETTTAQQALFFLNSDFVLEQAEAAAELLIQQSPDDRHQQITNAYLRALARRPTRVELAAAAGFLERSLEALQDAYDDPREQEKMALASFVQTLFGSAEFRYLIHAPSAELQHVFTEARTQ